jgi:hypothetical protein
VKLAELEAVGMRGTVAVCESEPGVVDLSKEVTHQYEKARPREQKGKGELTCPRASSLDWKQNHRSANDGRSEAEEKIGEAHFM